MVSGKSRARICWLCLICISRPTFNSRLPTSEFEKIQSIKTLNKFLHMQSEIVSYFNLLLRYNVSRRTTKLHQVRFCQITPFTIRIDKNNNNKIITSKLKFFMGSRTRTIKRHPQILPIIKRHLQILSPCNNNISNLASFKFIS